MATWSYVNGSAGTGAFPSDTTVDTDSLDVAAGDLLVGIGKFDGDTRTIAIADVDGGNAFTIDDVVVGTNSGMAMGYKINASAANKAFRLTLGSGSIYRYVAVMQFRPDPDKTVTLEALADAQTFTSSPSTSQTISPQGDDLVVVGGIGSYDGALNTPQVGGSAATGSIIDQYGYGAIWYRFFTSNQTDITASITSSTNASIINVIAFKAEAAAATSALPMAMNHYRRMRN